MRYAVGAFAIVFAAFLLPAIVGPMFARRRPADPMHQAYGDVPYQARLHGRPVDDARGGSPPPVAATGVAINSLEESP